MTTELNYVYQKLGIKRKNVLWSPGGRDEEGKIYLNLWWHLFSSTNEYTYKRRPGTKSPGFSELRMLIKDALANHDGIVGGIMVVAKDKDASPRQVARAWRTGDLRITSFDEEADAFTAVRV
jgi:hypothetical protein